MPWKQKKNGKEAGKAGIKQRLFDKYPSFFTTFLQSNGGNEPQRCAYQCDLYNALLFFFILLFPCQPLFRSQSSAKRRGWPSEGLFEPSHAITAFCSLATISNAAAKSGQRAYRAFNAANGSPESDIFYSRTCICLSEAGKRSCTLSHPAPGGADSDSLNDKFTCFWD